MLVSDIKRRVAKIFGDESSTQIDDTDIVDWVNDGQKDICRKTECLETIATANIVAGTEGYNYPDLFLRENKITVDGRKIARLTVQAIDQLYPDRAVEAYRGSPLYYFHYNRQFRLYPIPVTSGTNTLSIWYVKYAAEVVDANSTPQIPVEFHEDLVRYCLWRAYEMDEQFTVADRLQRDYNERLLQTAYDAQVEGADSYPSVRAIIGDY